MENKTETQAAQQKKTKRTCPQCGSKNTYSNPKVPKHLYCNHCGYESFT